MKFYTRTFDNQKKLALRADQVGKQKYLVGHAAIFEVDSKPIYENGIGFIERLAKKCFSQALKTAPDVTFNVNHDDTQLLGRTANGSLELHEDNIGLAFRVRLPDTQLARDTWEMVNEGLTVDCSFAFSMDPNDEGNETWSMRGNKDIRTINRIGWLFDTCVTLHGAYGEPSVKARNKSLQYRSGAYGISAPDTLESQTLKIDLKKMRNQILMKRR